MSNRRSPATATMPTRINPPQTISSVFKRRAALMSDPIARFPTRTPTPTMVL
ncbi:Uncharacterised protein [Mycobacterium tuberculosis]|uniref:Uncharacterized protein n=1 Tax=Mycobacterium tuberculosis TaxID=1773 RepID=A0A916LHL3_MYCTX|nr:Uncharacterised protein [Mycobacterium tuberculosis]